MSETSPDAILSVLKKCKNFNDLPDDSDPFAERKISLHQPGLSNIVLSEGDAEEAKYQEYLRSRWPISEAIPAEFDPDELEASWKRQFGPRVENDPNLGDSKLSLQLADYDSDAVEIIFDQVSSLSNMDPQEANGSSESLCTDGSVTESLDSDEELEGYESEVAVQRAASAKMVRVSICNIPQASAAVMCQPSTETIIERKPTPRIRTGSKPPLSRSALSCAGLPSPKEGYQGKGPSMTLKGYPQAPKYFPFRSRVSRQR
ncbi:hypothetical protein GGS26DRAFT_514877 [Hypomontagnella submonticulosa]|nr:hypothetical protein GGS26DRAFT_514877 [Hypomontagnella submonticulosa]